MNTFIILLIVIRRLKMSQNRWLKNKFCFERIFKTVQDRKTQNIKFL